ncbi:MAG TPA: hypothetical protein VMS89_09710 [Methanoregulaceae archaeon]|nr:hypothetical protein [Methanoregulaceae archaeon]
MQLRTEAAIAEKEMATKRIPVSPSTWSALHDERQAGESYDAMLQRLMTEAGRFRLIQDTDKIENSGDFIDLDDLDR